MSSRLVVCYWLTLLSKFQPYTFVPLSGERTAAYGGAENAGQENDGQKSSREKLLDGGLSLPTPFRYHFTTYSFLLIHLVPVI